jgi:hypothetical protein
MRVIGRCCSTQAKSAINPGIYGQTKEIKKEGALLLPEV